MPTASLLPPEQRTLNAGPILCVARFILNAAPKPALEAVPISRTFGKVAIIDKTWLATMSAHIPVPQSEENWLVELISDQYVGQNRGVLVCLPKYKLAEKEPSRLFPGSYTEELIDGTLYLRPQHPGLYWIASRSLKADLLKRYDNPPTLIVPLPEPPDMLDRVAAIMKR